MSDRDPSPGRPDLPTLQPIPHTRLVDEAARSLRKAILSGQFQPGQRLPENALARDLGLSRTPLREAFRMLEEEGMVTVSRSRGVEVVKPDLQATSGLYDVREVLDGLAARRAAAVISDEQIASLAQLLAHMEACVNSEDYHGWLRDNIEFHMFIVLASGNRYLARYQPTIQASVQMFHPTLVRRQDRVRKALDEHRIIFVALTARNPAQAEEVAREHIRRAKRVLIEALDGGPGEATEDL